jgi:hypothetical protein
MQSCNDPWIYIQVKEAHYAVTFLKMNDVLKKRIRGSRGENRECLKTHSVFPKL